jgi:hypothetical protein
MRPCQAGWDELLHRHAKLEQEGAHWWCTLVQPKYWPLRSQIEKLIESTFHNCSTARDGGNNVFGS